MALLCDHRDPTVALFTSEQGADKASTLVMGMYRKTVRMCTVRLRRSRGEVLGWQCIAHKTDGTSAPITNSDFERLQEWQDKTMYQGA